ncbi:FkbM family methyltransferase [Methylobacterium sp. E-016]|jgi:FkbM family methyltransferase|uniref:FkbM family methyltransferase n=1 Tax=Methylobacterium sp. E-016 TaxID=2836556 RepID=UPI001FBA4069|nr:FkbM family methyltransferase [Methylobacterium sp. E-016]MCJ2074287.1 FkbM family methyltransferase [Methylobacterium sp. E-016]
MTAPTKSVTLNGTAHQITGLSKDDAYFASITDPFEPDFQGFCARHLKHDYVCWDFGANIGITTLMMSGLCPNGSVEAVEANRPVHALLCQNLAQNGISNATPHHVAIGGHNGRAFFNEVSAYGHMTHDPDHPSVTMITPETLLTRSGERLPDFIKIDCEGFEPTILKSATDLIWRSNALVHFEFNTWCLLHHSREQPLEVLIWILHTFPETFVVREGGALERFGLKDISQILHDNLMKYGCVNDFVVTFEPGRLS